MKTSDSQPHASTQADDTPSDHGGAPEFSRDIRWVAHGDLHLEHRYWTNPRSITGLDDASLREIGEDIMLATTTNDRGEVHAGVRVAFEVVKVIAPGGYINLVTDGQRRHRAIALVGLPPEVLIPVLDLEPEPVELTPDLASQYLMRALKNVGQRAGLSSFELVENAARLRATKNPETKRDYTLGEIGKAIGRSESWVSKMLTAMSHASPKLIDTWRKGEITDEMFKDTAALKSPDKQANNLDKAVDARKAGDKGLARNLAKESLLIERGDSTKTKPAASGKDWEPTGTGNATKIDTGTGPRQGKGDRVVRGPQADLFDKNAPAAAPVRKATPFAVIEDFLAMTERTPPTHDYMRGLIDGAKWATGLKDPKTFGKPWHVYMNRVQGTPAAPKAPKAPKPSQRPKLSGSKAKAAKPAAPKAPPKALKSKGKATGKPGKKR